MTDRVLNRLGTTRTEHVDAAVRMLGRLQGIDRARTEIAVAHARNCLADGQAAATAVKSAEIMLQALKASPNVLPLRTP